MLEEQIAFQSFHWQVAGGLCPEGETCTQWLEVFATGESQYFDDTNLHTAIWSSDDVVTFGDLATSDEVVAVLRDRTPCPGVTDSSESIEVQIAPGVYVHKQQFLSIVGCGGVLDVVREEMRAMIARYYP